MSNEDQVTVTLAEQLSVATDADACFCIGCGQPDEPHLHDPTRCPAYGGTLDAVTVADALAMFDESCEEEPDLDDEARALHCAIVGRRHRLAQPSSDRETIARIIDPYIDDDGSHGAYMAWETALRKADAIIALTPSNRSDAVDGETVNRAEKKNVSGDIDNLHADTVLSRKIESLPLNNEVPDIAVEAAFYAIAGSGSDPLSNPETLDFAATVATAVLNALTLSVDGETALREGGARTAYIDGLLAVSTMLRSLTDGGIPIIDVDEGATADAATLTYAADMVERRAQRIVRAALSNTGTTNGGGK